ncbi:MAG: ABC transporter ATP-binding protein [Lachnospiraceae bacterium]|uniref:ABC transporter ATP-binding protein n=1 Tax=Candidatus Merdisoma sp. JLR.KK011 TaxID=3114299 RepID=UPI0014353C25|nr:ABC transporter ATP-binding protein [Lachnospiraceae bacterium]GFI08938.1 high-affinity branched-chain amino acid transport ATP-binding protein LivF [Lachnospiraceae bacterium]
MLMEIKDLCAGYGDLQVLFDISMEIGEGEVVSLVGSNGAGKTTLLRIISGLEPVKSGSITYGGKDLTQLRAYEKADYGIAHIPQGRGILGSLSVKENLIMGAYPKSARAHMEENIEKSFEMFPILKERENQMAGSLSGGEQQMLAIARALMIRPKLLMLDEPSLGLAPIVVNDMFRIISEVAGQGMSILIVEQNLKQALSVADRGYVLETGRIVMEGKASELLEDKAVQAAYLGI